MWSGDREQEEENIGTKPWSTEILEENLGLEPRMWKILEKNRDLSLREKEALKPRKRKHWSPGKVKKTETMQRNNEAFGNGHPRALEKENLKLRKRNVDGMIHLGLRKKETIDLLTKKPWSH